MRFCPGCGKHYKQPTRYYQHILNNRFCAQAAKDEKAEEEREKQARDAKEAADAAAAAAIASAAQEKQAQESERQHDSPPIEDESFPFADDDCDGDEDSNKETEGNEDGDDDEEEEDEAKVPDDASDAASDESDDSGADENDCDPVRLGVRVSFPFRTKQSGNEERYFHGTITSQKGPDQWQVTFDDTEIFEYSYQDTLLAVGVYQEMLEQGDIEDSENEGDDAAHGATQGGEDAQEEEAPTDGILHDVCKLIDGVREDSDICGNPKGRMTPQNQAAAQLIALLQDSNAPLSLYSAITGWVKDNADNGTFNSGGKLPTRDKILKNLANRYHMKGLKPKEDELILPNAGCKIKVNTFSFTETLKSLLTDPELMKDENFAFPDPNDPFSAPEKWTDDKDSPQYQQQKNRKVGDLVGGRWYARTYHARCDASKKEILCPIIIFVDKTHSDVKGRLTQEPVMYTLGIFNQKTRNNPRAWRPLGLLPNFKSVREDRNSDRKQEDFHFVLSHVLQELKDVQKKEGVRVKFPYRGKDITAVFKVPTACVLGDHEGQNKNCGHKGCNTIHFCRRCDIKKKESDKPKVGKPVKAEDIDKLRMKGDEKDELDARSHYNLRKGTAYTGMDFGAHDGGGINQYSFADVMHTIKHGLMDHIRLLLFDEVMPGRSEKDLRKHAKRLKSNDQEYGGRTKAGEKNEKVIAKRVQILLDDVAKYWGRLLLHQSDRSLGKTHFPSGIASGLNSKFTCEEMPSVLLLLTMILASDIGRQFFETTHSQEVRKAKLKDGGMQMRMDSYRTADYIWAFEECIMMCELFASDLMTVEFVETYLRPYIGLLIERWTRKLPRNKGDGWRMVKFHNLMHFPDILLEMGNSKVSDTETGEHGHIRVKSLAQKTQRVLRTFDRQVAVRLYEDWAIIRARSELSGLRTPKKQPGTEQATAPVSSPKFVFDSRGEMSAYKNTPKTNCTEFHDTKLQGQVSGFLRTAVCEPMNMSEGETLTYYTEARVNDQLYRADPVFHTLRGENRGWHDVAMATHPHHKQKKVPVQLLGFLRFDNLQKPFDIPRQFKKFNSRVDNKTRLAIVHAFESAPKEPFHPTDSSKDEKEKAIQEKLHRQSRLLSVGKKILKQDGGQQDGLFLIRVEEIKEPCLAVPDVTAVAVQKGRAVNYTFTPAKRYIFVKSRSKWAEIYKTWITREVKDELAKKKKK